MCLAIKHARFVTMQDPQQRRQTRETLNIYARSSIPISKFTMQVSQNNAEKISKNKKVPINSQDKERHLCGETNTTAQAQETQNDSTATLCSGFFMSKRVLAEGANKLTQEEIAMLEFDIFKPLDFNEILFNRMKSGDYQGRIIANLSEL